MHAATRVGVGYNIQIAVDTKHKLIAEQQVHNKVSDLGLLAETAEAALRNLVVDRIDAVADAGYFKTEDIEACEKIGVVPHVPKPQRGSTVSQGLFPKERFRYDGAEDIYICPNDQRLTLHSKRKRRDLSFASYANRAGVQGVPTQVEVYEERLPSGPALCRRSDPGAHGGTIGGPPGAARCAP